jgi:dihydrodipicolinate synthase/N-acetylneuraminate lyase
MHDIIALGLANRYEEARKLHEQMIPLFKALVSDKSPIPLEAMLSHSKLGFGPTLRSPLFAMSDEQADALCAPFTDLLEAVR